MAENVTNERILEHLKAIQSKLSTIEGRLQSLETDMRGLKGRMASFLQAGLPRTARSPRSMPIWSA